MDRPATPKSPHNPVRASAHPSKPHKHHISHRHHHSKSTAPQSAIEASSRNPFSDILRKDADSSSPSQSRPSSLLAAEGEAREARLREEETQKRKMWAEVQRRKARRKGGSDELRTALTALTTLSTTTTRSLDYTYYSLLSKLSYLASTITSLRDLLLLTRTLSTTFTATTSTLVIETSAQIETHTTNFTVQQQRVEELERRMKRGRAKIEALSQRLETVRERVEGWERRESEWTKKMGERWRWCWKMFGTILGFVVLLAVWNFWGSAAGSGAPVFGNGAGVPVLKHGDQFNNTGELMKSSAGNDIVNQAISGERVSSAARGISQRAQTTSKPIDDPLRLFDEL